MAKGYSPADMGMNCAFDDTSMLFGTLHALKGRRLSQGPSGNCGSRLLKMATTGCYTKLAWA